MKILCPYHKESTPSFHVYPDGSGHCYGCGAHEGPSKQRIVPDEERYVEDIQASIKYIKSLPRATIRGLSLHHDNDYYYVVWPSDDYYVRRRKVDVPDRPKYVGAAGHRKPIFIARERSRSVPLIVVEGQLNALSMAEAEIQASVVSPGAATDFKKLANLPYYMGYDNIVLVLDNDAAGAMGAIELKGQLLAMGKTNVRIHLVNEDANEILQAGGPDAVREYASRLGML